MLCVIITTIHILFLNVSNVICHSILFKSMDFVTHFVGICKTRLIHMNTLHAVSIILTS